jgi:hypothetical protein
MSVEPDFIAQCGDFDLLDPGQDQDIAAWWMLRGHEAVAEGCIWLRMSVDVPANLMLLEGWHRRPASEGEPRFLLARVD